MKKIVRFIIVTFDLYIIVMQWLHRFIYVKKKVSLVKSFKYPRFHLLAVYCLSKVRQIKPKILTFFSKFSIKQ